MVPMGCFRIGRRLREHRRRGRAGCSATSAQAIGLPGPPERPALRHDRQALGATAPSSTDSSPSGSRTRTTAEWVEALNGRRRARRARVLASTRCFADPQVAAPGHGRPTSTAPTLGPHRAPAQRRSRATDGVADRPHRHARGRRAHRRGAARARASAPTDDRRARAARRRHLTGHSGRLRDNVRYRHRAAPRRRRRRRSARITLQQARASTTRSRWRSASASPARSRALQRRSRRARRRAHRRRRPGLRVGRRHLRVRRAAHHARGAGRVRPRAPRSAAACGPRSSKPIIAMIRGYCIGGGLLDGDAGRHPHRRRGQPVRRPAARLGLGYGYGGVGAVDLVGPAYAAEILFSARRLDADEALRIGLVNRVVPVDRLEAEVHGPRPHDRRRTRR